MMINTEILGEIDYSDEDVIVFDDGLYGFGGMKNFILLLNPVQDLPFHFLQSTEDMRLSFIVTSPFIFVDNYDFEISDQITEMMKIDSIDEIEIFTIAVIPENLEDTTINLKAPIIVNKKNKVARQYILNEDYPYKKYIFKKGDMED